MIDRTYFETQVRAIDAHVDEVEEYETATFHAQMDADVELARSLGVPEPVIREECKRVNAMWLQVKEAEWHTRRELGYRSLWRIFKQRLIQSGPARCFRCRLEGKSNLVSELRPRVVMGGDWDRQFNPLLWERVCKGHQFGSALKLNTNGIDGETP